MWRLGALLLTCLFLGACGGGSSSPTSGGSGPTTAPQQTTPGTPTSVDVSHGTNAAGVDIIVSAPSSSPAPNAQDLGVNATTGQASASNTGGVIHRGSTMRVILFGPGLNGQMQVRIAGPNDITVSSITGVQATDNTPGISFIATASGSAALGARTVFLQTTSGDVTSFTGGLEVAP